MKITTELKLSENDAKAILNEVKNAEIIKTENGRTSILLEIDNIALLELYYAGKKQGITELITETQNL